MALKNAFGTLPKIEPFSVFSDGGPSGASGMNEGTN